MLLALLRTLWRLSYQEVHDWLSAWPGLALACGLPLGAAGRPRVPSKAQQSKRQRAAGAPASEIRFVLLIRASLWMGPTSAQDLTVDSAPICYHTGMELILFTGLQAAGKSTFYRERFAGTHTLVSKDMLRNNPRPEGRQEQLIAEALAAGRSVVVDNTNPTPEVRAPLIALGRRYGATIVGYSFVSTAGESLARNRQRQGKARVPDVAIFATRKRLVPPSYAEGFDQLYAVRIAEGGRFAVAPWT